MSDKLLQSLVFAVHINFVIIVSFGFLIVLLTLTCRVFGLGLWSQVLVNITAQKQQESAGASWQ